jgi:hypothetical protein
MSDSILDGVRGYLNGQQERSKSMRESVLAAFAKEENAHMISSADLHDLASIGAIARGTNTVQHILDKIDSGELTEAQAVAELDEAVQTYTALDFYNAFESGPAKTLEFGAKMQFWSWIGTLLPR